LVGFLGVIAIGVIVLAAHWPFTQNARIRFLRHNHPEATLIITVQKLVIQGSLTGLFSSPKRLSSVRVLGMHMIIPPKTPTTATTASP
jgi:hypothetical protein